jgi:hypothetical protein
VTTARVSALLVAGVMLISCSSSQHRAAPTSTNTRSLLSINLMHRPLHLPRAEPGAACPVTRGASQPTAALGVMLGDGPVRPVGVATGQLQYVAPSNDLLNEFHGSKWGGNKLLWAVGPTINGDVLIRGHQVDGTGELRFGLAIAPDADLLLHGPGATSNADGWRDFPSTTRVQHPGCYAFQIDTTSTSTLVVIAIR